MSNYANSYERQATPDVWRTVSYDVRRLKCAAWQDGIASLAVARDECANANRVCAPGHAVYARQEYVGDLPTLRGKTRVVSV